MIEDMTIHSCMIEDTIIRSCMIKDMIICSSMYLCSTHSKCWLTAAPSCKNYIEKLR